MLFSLMCGRGGSICPFETLSLGKREVSVSDWRSSWKQSGGKQQRRVPVDEVLGRVMAFRSAYVALEVVTSFLKGLCDLESGF